MKSVKSLLLTAAACMMLASCGWDGPEGISTKHPVGTPGSGDDTDPVNPDTPGSTVTSPKPTFGVTQQVVNIDTKTTYQEWEGFAASDCWLGEYIGNYWNPSRNEVARMLFSQKIIAGQPQGIGLSMWRVNLGAGSYEQGSASNIDNVPRRAQSYLASNGTYDWNKCPGQRWLMEQAKLNGVEKFVFFSNSPLVQFTKNGKATRNGDSRDWYANLKADCFDDFAEYMATVAEHFVSAGYNVTHISPVNEPQWAWDGRDQEGTPWHNDEIAKIASELQKSLDARKISTRILIPEASDLRDLTEGNDFNHNMIKNFFTEGKSCYVGNIDRVDKLVCGHSYNTYNTWSEMRSVRTTLAAFAKQYGVRVWQTEWSMLGDAPTELGNYDNVSEFDIAMYMSRVIHNDIAVGGCSSWSYWTALGVERYSQKNRFELIFTTPAGGNYDENWSVNGSVKDNANLWVLGNYSLFVRPQFKRVKMSYQESKNFFGTTWLSADGKRMVVVLTNYDKEKGVTLKTAGSALPGNPVSVKRYTTTVSKNMLEEAFNPADDVFVEPYSVSTIVYDF